jgi:TonB family protein
VRAFVVAAVLLCGAARVQAQQRFEPPVLETRVEPRYPDAALAAGRSAVVLLELVLDEEGKVADAKVIAPAGYGFDEAALEAAKQMRFRPGRADGKPVSVKVTWRMKFAPKVATPPSLALPAPTETDKAAPPAPPPVRLRGEIVERGTRTLLEGVAVVVTDAAGATLGRGDTDAAGRFEVRLPADLAGPVTVVVAAADHRTLKLTETLRAKEALSVRYALPRTTYARYESTVRGAPVREEVARVSLSGDEIRRIPGTRGDALAAVLNLPSVSRSPFDLGQLVIRGSQPGESGAFLLGMDIPQTFHFGLGTSTFNSYLLERFDLIPSNFSVRYGRLVGGVVDMVPRAPKRDRWHGDIKLDIYDGHVIAEGPVGKGALALSLRRSWVDAVLGAVLPSGSVSVAPRYYDYQGLFEYPVAGGRLRLVLFGSDDELSLINKDAPDSDPSLRGRFGTKLSFHSLIASWEKRWRRVELDASLKVGYTHQDALVAQAARFDLDVVNVDLRLETRVHVSKRLRLTAGLDLQTDWYDVAVTAPRPVTEERPQGPLALDEKKRLADGGYEGSPAIYLAADWRPRDWVSLTPGMRVDWFAGRSGTFPQPRLLARFRVARTAETWVKFGAGLYIQPPQAPYDNPVLGNPRVRPTQALHLTAGVETRPIPKWPAFKIEVNGFYKDLRYVVVTSDALTQRDGAIRPEVYSDEGVGRVYGVDFLVKHDSPKYVFGWIAYTLTKSERQDAPNGPWRPFQYDQTHILTIVAGAHLPKDFDVGLRFRWVTGNPETPLLANGLTIYASDVDTYLPQPGAPFSGRLPDFIALDLRVDKRFVMKSWILAVYLDVANVTNRANVEAFNYSYDYTRRAPITGLPIVPSLGLRASF